MKFINTVDLQELKGKTTLESLERDNAILLKELANKDIEIEELQKDIGDIMREIAMKEGE